MKQSRPAIFRGRHFEPEIIATCVRWYLRFSLSLRNVEEMMAERGQGYVDMEGRPIENCIFLSNANRQPVWDLQDEDHETINRYAKILTLAAFSKNDYNMNGGCYANSTHFQFVRQRFTIPVGEVTPPGIVKLSCALRD
jgi:hypothetical protein